MKATIKEVLLKLQELNDSSSERSMFSDPKRTKGTLADLLLFQEISDAKEIRKLLNNAIDEIDICSRLESTINNPVALDDLVSEIIDYWDNKNTDVKSCTTDKKKTEIDDELANVEMEPPKVDKATTTLCSRYIRWGTGIFGIIPFAYIKGGTNSSGITKNPMNRIEKLIILVIVVFVIVAVFFAVWPKIQDVKSGKQFHLQASVIVDEMIQQEQARQLEIAKLTEEVARLKQEQAKPTTTSQITQEESVLQTAKKHFDRGVSLANQENYDLAIAEFTKALKLDQDMQIAYIKRGDAYLYKDDLDRAFTDYNRAIQIDPQSVLAYERRGFAYRFYKNDNDKAIYDYSQVIRLRPDDYFAYSDRGEVYFQKGDYDKAITDYSQMIKIDPKRIFAYTYRGEVYLHKGNYDKAIADYNQAIRIDPKCALTYINRGDAHSRKGDHGRAFADYNQATRIDPKSAFDYEMRGDAYSRKSEYDKAIADYEKALQIDPDHYVSNLENARNQRNLQQQRLSDNGRDSLR